MKALNLCRNNGGFTLVEVLIAAVVASIAIAAGFKVFENHNRSHVIQIGITNMQQNGRAAADQLVHDIRQAGYRLPGSVPSLQAWNTDPDTIAIAFLKEPACTASVSDPMPLPSAEIKCKDSDLSCFHDNTWAYIYDPAADSGELFFITHVQKDAFHFQHNLGPLSKCYGPGSEILMLELRKYYIDNTDTLNPKLMVQNAGASAEVYADDIEDLQFRYKMADGSILDTITVARYVREVLFQLIARTHKRDLFLDQYRHYVLASRVELRNLGGG